MLTRRMGLGLIGAAMMPMGRAMAADDLIRIGAAVSLTGKLSREGNQLRNGYVYWEKLVAKSGGVQVGDRKVPVKVFYYDDESDPQTSARLTERCITEDGVGFMFGPYSSGVAIATAAITEKPPRADADADGHRRQSTGAAIATSSARPRSQVRSIRFSTF